MLKRNQISICEPGLYVSSSFTSRLPKYISGFRITYFAGEIREGNEKLGAPKGLEIQMKGQTYTTENGWTNFRLNRWYSMSFVAENLEKITSRGMQNEILNDMLIENINLFKNSDDEVLR